MKTHSPGILVVIAIVLRTALLAAAWKSPEGLFTPDSRGYVELAENMVHPGEFQRAGESEIFRTPGYPGFLMLTLAGGEQGWRYAVMAQILLDAALVYVTFLLGAMLCDQRVGFWAAAFQAFSPVAVVSSVRILSDGLFAFLLTLAILLAAHHFRTRRRWSLLGAAAVLAAGCYVRPVGLAIAGVIFVILLLRPGRLANAGAFAAVLLAAVAPWVVRNGLAAGYWGFSSLPAQAAFDYQAPAVLADRDGVSLELARDRMHAKLADAMGPPPHSPGEVAAAELAVSRQVLAGETLRYAKLHARGDLAVWMPAATDVLEIAGVTAGNRGTLEVLQREGVLAAVRHYFGGKTWAIWLCAPMAAILAIEYVLALAGAVRRIRPRMGAAPWLVLATILALTLLPGPAGHPRFRTPVSPLLALAAGAGLVGLFRRGKGPATRMTNDEARMTKE